MTKEERKQFIQEISQMEHKVRQAHATVWELWQPFKEDNGLDRDMVQAFSRAWDRLGIAVDGLDEFLEALRINSPSKPKNSK